MRKFLGFMLFGALSLGAVSCTKSQENYPMVQAVVTVKTANDNSCFLQLNDEVALSPTNKSFQTNPFGKEVRAHVIYTDKGPIESIVGHQWREVTINAIDTILTKKPVEKGPDYGDSSIEIMDSWMTVMEDGYLTLRFEAFWGAKGVIHRINLVKTDKSDHFTLCHDNAGDSHLFRNAGLVAFDMHDLLPATDNYTFYVEYQGYIETKVLKIQYLDGEYTISREDKLYQ